MTDALVLLELGSQAGLRDHNDAQQLMTRLILLQASYARDQNG